MGLLSNDKRSAKVSAKVEYREAKKALARHKTDKEDDEYHRRNSRVIAAGNNLPWWKR